MARDPAREGNLRVFYKLLSNVAISYNLKPEISLKISDRFFANFNHLFDIPHTYYFSKILLRSI